MAHAHYGPLSEHLSISAGQLTSLQPSQVGRKSPYLRQPGVSVVARPATWDFLITLRIQFRPICLVKIEGNNVAMHQLNPEDHPLQASRIVNAELLHVEI